VHPITEQSPFYGVTLNQLKEMRAEVIVYIKAYDEVFANTVVARTSYTADEFIENAKFKPMYHSSPSGKATVLNINELNSFELLDLK
ncbi:MAG: Ion transport 2 domain protein, partial [Bacteroidota bacterium]|nr:Ion transport 2 domain protein [Bacteroidota bacterium]